MNTNPLALREQLPGWYTRFSTMFLSGAAHGFLLCGDIHGTAVQGISQTRFLQTVLGKKFSVVVSYHRATGITFPLESMRKMALEWLGLSAPAPATIDPMSAALAASGLTMQSTGDAFDVVRKPLDVLALLETLLRAPQARGKVVVMLDSADLLCPPTGKEMMSEDALNLLATLLLWGNDMSLGRQNNPVFLLTRRLEDLHPDLRESDSGYKVIDITLPDQQTRVAYLAWYLQQREDRGDPIPLRDLTLEEAGWLGSGLNLSQLEEVLLYGAMGEDGGEQPVGLSRALMKSLKDDIIKRNYGQIAEMIEPLPGGFSALGGMQQLKVWSRDEIIGPVREGRLQDVPKGILLVGPPGTGKGYYTSALAGELGFSAVALRMDNILNSLVGSSERNLREFFAFVRALAPVFVFVDEIDQTDLSSRGKTGSPVGANLFGAMLQFMSDERLRGRVIMVFASNRPDLLDPALLRFGRMDAIIPVLLPGEEERQSIIEVQARMQGTEIASEAAAWLAQQTQKYSAGDLGAVVAQARRVARRAKRLALHLPDVQAAYASIRPATLKTADEYTRLALAACNNWELLSPDMRQMLESQKIAPDAPAEQTLPASRSSRRW